MTFIQIENLSKTYTTRAGSLNVLNGVNLNIQKGSFTLLLGPSGSGKSTFMNMITAVDRPTSGRVVVDGVEVSKKRNLTRWRGRNIGIVFQQFQLLSTLTVLENVIMPMDFCNVHKASDRKAIAMDLLTQFGIAEQANKTPDLLSGGQQQRVAIARALANKPALVIGDEPTANLDNMSAKIVFDVFRQMTLDGHTFIIATHDRELATSGAADILMVEHGNVASVSPEEAAKRRTEELRKISTQEIKKLSTREMKKLALAQ